MGFLICALLWGVVLIAEIERTSDEQWKAMKAHQIFLLKNTRSRVAFILALALGAFFLIFELKITIEGRSTFNLIQALGLGSVLFGCFLYALSKKGE